MLDENSVEKQNDLLDLKAGINRLEGHSDHYFGRGTCKKVEQKTNSKWLEQKRIKKKQLEDIFYAIDELLAVLEKGETDIKLEKYDLVLRLMSATRKDLLTHKQLVSEINTIALKEPHIAKAFSELKDKVYILDEHVDVKQLIEYALFMK